MQKYTDKRECFHELYERLTPKFLPFIIVQSQSANSAAILIIYDSAGWSSGMSSGSFSLSDSLTFLSLNFKRIGRPINSYRKKNKRIKKFSIWSQRYRKMIHRENANKKLRFFLKRKVTKDVIFVCLWTNKYAIACVQPCMQEYSEVDWPGNCISYAEMVTKNVIALDKWIIVQSLKVVYKLINYHSCNSHFVLWNQLDTWMVPSNIF